MKNKIISILTTLALVITLIPGVVFADNYNEKLFEYDGYSINYSIANSWGNNQNVTVTITNTGNEVIRNWALQYEPCGTIIGIWNAEIYDSYIVKNSYYNSDIDIGSSVTYGYTLTDVKKIPTKFSLCSYKTNKLDNYTVDLTVQNNWDDGNTGFVGQITITNLSDKPIMAWELSFITNFDILSVHNFNIAENTNRYYTINGAYNGNIPAFSSVQLGFNGSKEDFPEIKDVSMTEFIIIGLNDENNYIEDTGLIGKAYFKETESWDDVDYTVNGICYVKNQILITAKDNVSFNDIESLVKNSNAQIVGYIELTNDYQIEFNEEKTEFDLDEIIFKYSTNSLMEYVSLNTAFEFIEDDNVTTNILNDWNDTSKSKNNNNWHLYKAKIIEAWELLNEKDIEINVKMGIIENYLSADKNVNTNISFQTIWNIDTTKDTIPNFVINSPWDSDENIQSHGIHVAGIMAGKYNPTEKTSGVCPGSELYGFSFEKSIDKLPSHLMKYKYAFALLIGNGVKAINVSMGTKSSHTTTLYSANALEKLFKNLIDNGHEFLIISTAGNNSRESAEWNSFLNQIDEKSEAGKRIIVVGNMATTNKLKANSVDSLATSSSCGDRVDVLAPGTDIYSTVSGNIYTNCSGTSMAAPIVSGIAGMIFSVNNNLSGEQVKKIIKNTCAGEVSVEREINVFKYKFNEKTKTYELVSKEGEKTTYSGKYKYVDAYKAVTKALKENTTDVEPTDEITLLGTVIINSKGKPIYPTGKKINFYEVGPNNTKGKFVKDVEIKNNNNSQSKDNEYSVMLERGKYIVEIDLSTTELKSIFLSQPIDLTNINEVVFIRRFNLNSSVAKDNNSQVAVSEVEIVVDCENNTSTTITTDDNGNFIFDLDDGIYTITFTKNGYIPRVLQVEVIDGVMYHNGKVLDEILLIPIEITITGTVEQYNKTTEETTPVEGLEVTIHPTLESGQTGSEVIGKGTTNADGTYSIMLYEQGNITIVFNADNQVTMNAYNGEYVIDMLFETEDEEANDEDKDKDKDIDDDTDKDDNSGGSDDTDDDDANKSWTINIDDTNKEITVSVDEMENGIWITLVDTDGVTPKYYLNLYFDDYTRTGKTTYEPIYDTLKQRLCLDVYNSNGSLLRHYDNTCMVMNSMGTDELHDLFKYWERDHKSSYSVAWGYSMGSITLTEMTSISFETKGFYTYGTYKVTYESKYPPTSKDIFVGGSEWKMFGVSSGKLHSVSSACPFGL